MLRPRVLCVGHTLRLLLLVCCPARVLLCSCGVGAAVCRQRGDALPSLVARSHALLVYLSCGTAYWCEIPLLLCDPEGRCSCAQGALRAPTLFLCSCRVGTDVWCLYSLLLRRGLKYSCVLTVLVQQYGIYTRSCYVLLCTCGVNTAVRYC